MSHFTVLVIGENPEEQLAPFDESIDMPQYVRHTKQDLIDKGKKDMEWFEKNRYAEYLANPEKYVSECKGNNGHIKYITEEFPLRLKRTDEEIYQDEISRYEPKEIGSDGEVYSNYNPKSKWDWYSLGGRWSGMIKLKDGATGTIGRSGVFYNKTGIDSAKKGDIENLNDLITFAVLKDGVWYERGKMGWWAIVTNEVDETEWETKVKELLNDLPDDTLISIYDCHI